MKSRKRRPRTATRASADAPVLNIVGKKVALGPIRKDLLGLYQRWINDFEVTRTLDLPMRPFPLEYEEAWYQRATQSDRDLTFTIYDRKTLRPIGNAGLHQIDHQHRTADFGMAIGEKDFWGRGYGTESTGLILDYGFKTLGLNNIMLQVFSSNTAAIRAYEKAGFRRMGERRQGHRASGEIWNILFMDCLPSDRKLAIEGRAT
jgi:RimJ/RimL family protein N-acetyltransferase